MSENEKSENLGTTLSKEDALRQIIGTMVILNPKITNQEIKTSSEKTLGTSVGINLIGEIRKEIVSERANRYLEVTKEQTVATFEDMAVWAVAQLRKVISEEVSTFNDDGTLKQKFWSQKNRIEAIKAIADIFEKVLKMKMDLGILERNLGTIQLGVRTHELMEYVRREREGKLHEGGTEGS